MAADSIVSAEPAGVQSKKVWTTLITNNAYLTGLLTLDYSLKKHGTKYPLVALYTDSFPASGHAALDARRIPKQHVKYLLPTVSKDYSNDPRFYDCWSKLTPFGLTEYERVVQLDSDMVALQNMDELMELELDAPDQKGTGERVFAASHACVCNPLKRAHYPKNWIPENCAFTDQHADPDKAQKEGTRPDFGLGMPNGGLQVVNPSTAVYDLILERLSDPSAMEYDFADQSLLGDLFKGRWVALPYTYNALKTMRTSAHKVMWRDEEVKNLHFLLSPKPWEEKPGEPSQEIHEWWWVVNNERLAEEKKKGIEDGF